VQATVTVAKAAAYHAATGHSCLQRWTAAAFKRMGGRDCCSQVTRDGCLSCGGWATNGGTIAGRTDISPDVLRTDGHFRLFGYRR